MGEKKERLMDVWVDMSKVVLASQISGEDEEETVELKKMLREASDYISSFTWCGGIKESYLGIGIGDVVGVFLFRIYPKKKEIDEWIWVIVGDLPSAYITAEDSPNPACALDAYIGAMNEWIDAARSGRSVAELIPVNVPSTSDYADKLEKRLKLLDREILAYYSNDLKENQ